DRTRLMVHPLRAARRRKSRTRHVDVLHRDPAARSLLRLLLHDWAALHGPGSAARAAQHRAGALHVRHLRPRPVHWLAALGRGAGLLPGLAHVLVEFRGRSFRDPARAGSVLPQQSENQITVAAIELNEDPTMIMTVPGPAGALSGTRKVTRVEPIVPGSGAIEITSAVAPFTFT